MNDICNSLYNSQLLRGGGGERLYTTLDVNQRGESAWQEMFRAIIILG